MPIKYDQSQLLQLAQQPKKKGGRPRKFATPEEKRAADAEYHRNAYHRAKLLAEGKELPDELKPKRPRRFATDEERRESIIHRKRLFNANHKENNNRVSAIYRLRKKLN